MLYKKITDAASHLPTTAYRRRHANGRIRLFEAFNAKAAKPSFSYNNININNLWHKVFQVVPGSGAVCVVNLLHTRDSSYLTITI